MGTGYTAEWFGFIESSDKSRKTAICIKCGGSEDLSTIVGDKAICIHCVYDMYKKLQDPRSNN